MIQSQYVQTIHPCAEMNEENLLRLEYILHREVVFANVERLQKHKLEIGHCTGQGRTEASSQRAPAEQSCVITVHLCVYIYIYIYRDQHVQCVTFNKVLPVLHINMSPVQEL